MGRAADGNFRAGSCVWDGCELFSVGLPGANERDERVGMDFRVTSLHGRVDVVYIPETIFWEAWN